MVIHHHHHPLIFFTAHPLHILHRRHHRGSSYCLVQHSARFSISFALSFQPRLHRLIPNANSNDSKKYGNGHSNRKRIISWWQRFFFNEEGNWLGLKGDDDNAFLQEEEEGEEYEEESNTTNELSERDKFNAWKRRAETIVELREAQEQLLNQESRSWEDWLVDSSSSSSSSPDPNSSQDWNSFINSNDSREDFRSDRDELDPERGLVQYVRDMVLGRESNEDLLYEDRVFRYASLNSAKFLGILIVLPWTLDFLIHDYVLMPFLGRYVKTVPLAAKMLDVRRSQKLEIAKEIKVERARYRLEVEIGKSPLLSDEEVWLELRHKALELRDERRLQNCSAFANIWSDMVFGLSSFMLLYFNQKEVALLKFTGYKIINNITDTGKAFLIILITDIFLGYHSESGWQTLIEVIIEHYGLQVDQATITIFICLVPVIIDACVKLWLFKFLPGLSPKVSNIFREMTRH